MSNKEQGYYQTNRKLRKCQTCNRDIPAHKDNQFYCCEDCRVVGWEKHHPEESSDE